MDASRMKNTRWPSQDTSSKRPNYNPATSPPWTSIPSPGVPWMALPTTNDIHQLGLNNFFTVANTPARPYEDQGAIYFYHRERPYHEFSNSAPFSVVYQGRPYRTAAHLFQALRFLPHLPDIAEYIRCIPKPHHAKRVAISFLHLARPDWTTVNIPLQELVLRLKFEQHPRLAQLLVGTGNRLLVEESFDDFWGFGVSGLGRNELGRALMRLRYKLQVDASRWAAPQPSEPTHPPESYTRYEEESKEDQPVSCWSPASSCPPTPSSASSMISAISEPMMKTPNVPDETFHEAPEVYYDTSLAGGNSAGRMGNIEDAIMRPASAPPTSGC